MTVAACHHWLYAAWLVKSLDLHKGIALLVLIADQLLNVLHVCCCVMLCCLLCRGLGRPQQAPGPEGMPQEGPQVPTATTQAAPQASGLETRLSRRTSTKLHWKPLDMSVSSDAVEIVSPFNKAGPEKH